MRRAAAEQPVGDVTLAAPPVRELRAALARPAASAKKSPTWWKRPTAPGNTMGEAFSELLRRLLAQFDILYVDPMLPAFRELAAPALRARGGSGAGTHRRRPGERNRELADAGYHAQVHVEDHTSFVFLLENGKRLALRRTGDEYVHNSRRFTSAGIDGARRIAFPQRPAASGDSGFHAAHRGLHRRSGRDRVPGAIGR